VFNPALHTHTHKKTHDHTHTHTRLIVKRAGVPTKMEVVEVRGYKGVRGEGTAAFCEDLWNRDVMVILYYIYRYI